MPVSSLEEVCSWIDFGSNSTTDRFWALDPIDGTKGFLRGDQYAIALALIEKGACKNWAFWPAPISMQMSTVLLEKRGAFSLP